MNKQYLPAIRLVNKFRNKFFVLTHHHSNLNIPNIKIVEIEINSQCNLLCYNCDRNCYQAPRNEIFSIRQMRKFVNESLRLHWQWEKIVLIGGEPTLHPQLFKLFSILRKYKNTYPGCTVQIASNGFGPQVKQILTMVPPWVSIRNSKKKGRVHLFEKFNFAPIDRKNQTNFSFEKGCWITSSCGLGLNRFGYYPCGAGAAIDRIFGLNIGIKHLEKVSYIQMIKSLKKLCQYCGHFPVKNKMDLSKTQVYSTTWENALNEYQKHPTQLSIY